MHLDRVTIRNIRSITALTWDLAGKSRTGWHVIIGDNGSGKSSFVRSIALALVGPNDAAALRQSWGDWLRADSSEGEIELELVRDEEHDTFSGPGKPTKGNLNLSLQLRRENGTVHLSSAKPEPPRRHVWGTGSGWFCASYGPYRRFTGGDKDVEKLYHSQPKLARHLSVFGESVALTEATEWLQSLKFKSLEKDPQGQLLEPIRAFINQIDFLPHGTRLQDVTSRGVEFVDGNGMTVLVEDLSDGYRSILSMTFELIRQMALTFEIDQLFSEDGTSILPPGLVLIDEIDAHLHPTWQRRIGVWFRHHFPNVQFIVTTHSPLICQAAEIGTVFRLPRPGQESEIDEGQMIGGVTLERLLYGNVLDAYGTGAFGVGITRSESSREKLGELARLNVKELGSSLTEEERKKRDHLRQILPTAASAVSK